MGIEPTDKGFADLSLSHLGTAPRTDSIAKRGRRYSLTRMESRNAGVENSRNRFAKLSRAMCDRNAI